MSLSGEVMLTGDAEQVQTSQRSRRPVGMSDLLMMLLQAMLKPLMSPSKVLESMHAQLAKLQDTILMQSARDNAAFAADLAGLAEELIDDNIRLPAAYKYSHMAEFNEAIKWSQRRTPMAALLRTDTDFHSAAKVGSHPCIAYI